MGGAGGSRLVNTTVEASWVTVALDTVDGLKEVTAWHSQLPGMMVLSGVLSASR